jgi:hypothetical protein
VVAKQGRDTTMSFQEVAPAKCLAMEVQELIEAMSDPEKAQLLMTKYSCSRVDLLARADELSKKFSANISNVAVV